MRLFSILRHLTLFFSTIQAIPTNPSTPLSLPRYGSNPETTAMQASSRTDIDFRVAGIVSRDIPSTLTIIYNTLKVISTNFVISIPSNDAISQFITIYTQTLSLIAKSISTAPLQSLSFVVGAFKIRFSCAAQAIPWQLLHDIVTQIRNWVREQWAPVAATLSFLAKEPYFVAAPMVIVIGISVLARHLGTIYGGGDGGGGGAVNPGNHWDWHG